MVRFGCEDEDGEGGGEWERFLSASVCAMGVVVQNGCSRRHTVCVRENEEKL